MKAFMLLLALGLAQAQDAPQASDPPLREVKPEELVSLIDRADRLVVKDWNPETGERDKVVFESRARKDLDELKLVLKLKPFNGQFTTCMCSGSISWTFHAGDAVIGEIMNQHSLAIRYSLWDSDAELADPEPLLKWCDERKITWPRIEYEELKRQEEILTVAAEAAERKWIAAMPKPLIPLWPDDAWASMDPPDVAPFRAALAAQIEDRNERVLALLAWYGSGSWSDPPRYESAAEELLLDYPTAVLNAIGCGQELGPTQLEGLARLLAGGTFGQRRPDELALVSPALKARLLQHVKAHEVDDPTRLACAERAFGDG